MSTDIIEEIETLKENRNALLLVHNYQNPEVQELADFIGDSYELARKANDSDNKIIVFAGAEFMAETAAILNTDKKVLIPSSMVKCPMAHMLSPKELNHYKNLYPNATIVVYVNTKAETKALADVCITSANAVKIISKLDNNQVLVGPDRNLTYYIQKHVTDKEIIPFPENGHCYVHRKFQVSDVKELKLKFPDAEILAHPEVDPSVQDLADKICSTSGMIREANNSRAKKFIVATEIGLIDRLRSKFPSKTFIPARKDAICIQQKKITIYNLYMSLLHERFQISIPPEIASKARLAIERMLELSKS